MPFPFGPDLWLASDDLPGPEYASVGTWKDRTSHHNDASQEDGSKWAFVSHQDEEIDPAGRFVGDDNLQLKETLTAPSWTLWAVFNPNGLKSVVVSGNLVANRPVLITGFSIPFNFRTVSYTFLPHIGTVGVSAVGPFFTKPVFARVEYDGTTITLSVFNDFGGTASIHFPGATLPLSYVGFPGGDSSLKTDVGEVMYWKRTLSDEENAGVLRYLTDKYQPTEEEDVKPGTVIDFAGPVVPSGYLACDGTDYAEADYPDLATAIGHTWDTFRGQSAPASGRFRVPLLAGLVVVGDGGISSSPATSARTLAQGVGEEAHQLSVAELASHTHTTATAPHQHASYGGSYFAEGESLQGAAGTDFTTVDGAQPVTAVNDLAIPRSDATGSDTAHNNMQPSAVMRKCIKT